MIRRDKEGNLKSYCHFHGNGLWIAGRCDCGMDIIFTNLLENYNAKIYEIRYQSIYNYYVNYDYEPFDTTIFLKLFTVHGSKEYLTWLFNKINNYLDTQEQLEELLLVDVTES